MKNLKTFTSLASILFALSAYAIPAGAIEISGTISSTLTIFEDSRLVGDVTCAVPVILPGPNPCIAFGADHITLRLNGHMITGQVDPPADCSLPSDTSFGVGLYVNGANTNGDVARGVKIEGPGIIQNFHRWGILLQSASRITVRRVTINRNCWSGLQTFSTTDSRFEDNVWVNNAAGSNGSGCGGICLVNSNKNLIRDCTFSGNGSVDYPNGNVDFGIGFEGSSAENRVEQNDIEGNVNGILFFNTASDNLVRNNLIAGNPAAQVAKTFVSSNQQGADIAFRPTFTGANNLFENNFCLTYIGSGTSPCPNIRLRHRDADDDDDDRGHPSN